jgi:uncharacterized protein YabN with tetrapyrrole methylase and pyrophosphatase domain
MANGSLVIVGSGIYTGHLTQEARGWIECADKVLYCISDAATERLVLTLNYNAESLWVYYDDEKPRRETYRQMAERTLECVREGNRVCAVYYGHPGVLVDPSRASIALARSEGFSARIVPGISSVDCLFCDLGVDPVSGCQIFEATDVVLRRRLIDVYSHVIILQASSVGETTYKFLGWSGKHMEHLRKHLLNYYDADHQVTFYAAPQFPLCEPTIVRIPVGEIGPGAPGQLSTLYIPPIGRPPIYLPAVHLLNMDDLLKDIDLVKM